MIVWFFLLFGCGCCWFHLGKRTNVSDECVLVCHLDVHAIWGCFMVHFSLVTFFFKNVCCVCFLIGLFSMKLDSHYIEKVSLPWVCFGFRCNHIKSRDKEREMEFDRKSYVHTMQIDRELLVSDSKFSNFLHIFYILFT